jgi:hypothetical protein
VQEKANDLVAAASVAATLDAPPTAGNLIVAVVYSYQPGSNATLITGFTQAAIDPFSTFYRVVIFYRVAQGGDSATVTATRTAGEEMALWVGEYSESGTWSLDVVANDGQDMGTGVTSRATGTTAATAQNNELAIAAVARGNTITGPSWSNSFTNRHDGSRINVGEKILAATATQTSTLSWTTTRIAGGAIAVFKPTATGGDAPWTAPPLVRV